MGSVAYFDKHMCESKYARLRIVPCASKIAGNISLYVGPECHFYGIFPVSMTFDTFKQVHHCPCLL